MLKTAWEKSKRNKNENANIELLYIRRDLCMTDWQESNRKLIKVVWAHKKKVTRRTNEEKVDSMVLGPMKGSEGNKKGH